ncbi:MAG: M16 family metallopeptidase [Candidatus Gracilibacteria bacterium]
MYHSSQHTLSNGIVTILTDISHSHLCAVYAFVKTGSLQEEEGERGYAHLLEHLLLKRLTTHREDALTKFCTSRGMYFNAETSREYTAFYITDIMPEYLAEALNLMNVILFHPVFTAKDMEEEKDIVISELSDRISSPHYKMQRAFSEYYFGTHPLGREVGGKIDEVQNAEFERLMNFYKKHYVPENIVLSLAGPGAEKPNIRHIIDTTFALEEKKPHPASLFPAHIPPEKKDFMYTLDFAENVSLEYFFVIPGRNSYTEEERFAFYFYEDILGNSRYSRLFMKLREEKRLVYGVGVGTSYILNTGSFSIDTSCKKENVEEISIHISEALRTMRDNFVTSEELEEAKTTALVGYYQILDDVNRIASRAGHLYITRGILIQPEVALNRFKSVTVEQIQEVGKKYILPGEAYSYVTYKEELHIPHLTH